MWTLTTQTSNTPTVDKQLCFGKDRPSTLAMLEMLAHSMPGITERSGLARYEEANAFLRLPNVKDDMAKVKDEGPKDQNGALEEPQKPKRKDSCEPSLELQQAGKRAQKQDEKQNHEKENKDGEKPDDE
ncbi:hypothetical protein BKA81DRAFT_375943 [Phyllosticta paracitricarpa]